MSTSTPARTGRYVWDPAAGPHGALLPEPAADPAPATSPSLVADSWLVEDGRVRALPDHARRFRDTCGRLLGVPPGQVTGFLRAAVGLLPPRGRWFPRVEARPGAHGTRLILWLRPAPPRGGPVVLWHPGMADPRALPWAKGPDLDLLARLREAARAAGGDEPLLLSPSGHVREGGTTSLVWWRGPTLCLPPPGPDLLPGVTRALLTAEVAEAGHPVVFETATAADLAGVPVWAVNALHGIRPVAGWLNPAGELPPPPDSSAEAGRWQARLDRLALPVHPGLVPDADDPAPGTAAATPSADPQHRG
ncbi:aminotransferase class IV [Streptomyces sp. AF1A]|jgi:branched-subunit amino acid aminotransferase/4-amino-4-deoxychorismate lyase|uniref:aminotransferase class IV n=1 Tax=Streptomyces sp. AF1A TaxID=3394350 RepID=UPI0039BC9D0E